MNRPTSDSLPTLVVRELPPPIGDEAQGGATRSAGANLGQASLGAWARARLAATPSAIYEGLLIVAIVGVVWHLQQWISGFLLLAALVGWGAWRVTDVLFRPFALADRVLVTITFAAAWIVLVAEGLSVGRLLGQPVGWLAGGATLAIAGVWVPARPARWSGRA